VRFVTYAAPPEPADEMAVRSGARFGPAITLEGYTVRNSEREAGDIVQVTLFWRAEQPLETRYKVFLHLIDDEGALAAQRDAEPVGNLAPTTTWQPGQTVVDNHGLLLPTDLAAGRYTLHVGLYPLDDPGARLPLSGESGVGGGLSGDSFLLAEITVR